MEKHKIGLQFFATVPSPDAGASNGGEATATEVAQPSTTNEEKPDSAAVQTAEKEVAPPTGAGEAGENVKEEDIDAEFQALIGKGGKYNKLFTAKVDEILNKRHAQNENLRAERDSLAAKAKDTENSLAPLYQLFGASDLPGLIEKINSDPDLWEMIADRQGMTPGDLKNRIVQGAEIERLRRENEAFKQAEQQKAIEAKQKAQFDLWTAQIAELRKTVPDFDMQREMESNENFKRLVNVGIPINQAYGMTHIDDAVAAAKDEGRREAADAIASRQRRPQENAASRGSAVKTGGKSVDSLTKEERDEIEKRVMRGEKIDFVDNW